MCGCDVWVRTRACVCVCVCVCAFLFVSVVCVAAQVLSLSETDITRIKQVQATLKRKETEQQEFFQKIVHELRTPLHGITHILRRTLAQVGWLVRSFVRWVVGWLVLLLDGGSGAATPNAPLLSPTTILRAPLMIGGVVGWLGPARGTRNAAHRACVGG